MVYRLIAPMYDRLSPIWLRGYSRAYERLDELYADFLPPQGRVLDLGCGTGANLRRMEAGKLPVGAYLGIDQSPSMLARARSNFGHLPYARFLELDLERNGLPEGPFDLIVSTWALEHMTDPEKLVMNALGCLAPGGRIVLMFEVNARGWRERLLDPLWRLAGVYLRPLNDLPEFPGTVSIEAFAGPGPPLALVVLRHFSRPGQSLARLSDLTAPPFRAR